ncbi:MAG: c-type cytochrome [Alphaproteobacteria bacterium]
MDSHFAKLFALALVASVAGAGAALAHEKEGKAIPPEGTTAHSDTMEHQESSDTARRAQPTRLLMPMMNAARGRKLFASKGCVTCHSVNGVGGEDAASLDAHSMKPYMSPFDFAARMWRGAAAMIALQEEAFGEQIEFTGDELADIIAFVHDDEEQHRFSEADIPPEIMSAMHHVHHEPGGGAEAHSEELGHTPTHGTGQPAE